MWPKQATIGCFEVEKKDAAAASPSCRLPELVKLPVRIPDAATLFRPNLVENSSSESRPTPMPVSECASPGALSTPPPSLRDITLIVHRKIDALD
jgi:hypothetical protein